MQQSLRLKAFREIALRIMSDGSGSMTSNTAKLAKISEEIKTEMKRGQKKVEAEPARRSCSLSSSGRRSEHVLLYMQPHRTHARAAPCPIPDQSAAVHARKSCAMRSMPVQS